MRKPKRLSRAVAISPRPKSSAKPLPIAPRLPESAKSCSTAAVTSITAASRRSRMRRGKRGYSSKPMSKQILRDSLAVRRLLEVNPSDLKDDVVAINRVTKVVQGGKNLSFSALVVVGDSHGHAGFGMGKAREVPMAIKKGIEQAKKNLIQLNLKGTTIPHQVVGRYGSAQVLLKPAAEGTGVIAGGPVRKVMQVAGIHNVLTKSIGTSNPHNVIKATFAALLGLKDAAQVAETRTKTVEEITGKAKEPEQTEHQTVGEGQ